MPVQQGSNSKDHRAFLVLGGVDWGEYEEISSPEVTVENEIRFYPPGSSFETSGGGVFSIDQIEGQRHWKVGRDSPLVKQFDDAAAKGVQLEGTVSYYEVVNGVLAAAPWRAFPVFCSKCKGPDVNTSSEDALLEIGLGTTGGPLA